MKKYLYPILIIITAVAFYLYEDHQIEQISNENLESEHNTTTQNTTTSSGLKSLSRKDFLPNSNNQIIHHNTYSLSYNEKHEQAEWTAHVLKSSDIRDVDFERPYFEIDEMVTTGAAHWRNYKRSGYDRGHLVPAGDRRANKKDYNETFLTSNISPQVHEFNAGIWNTLEQKVRYYAKRYNEVYVITGPIFKNRLDDIGNENVSVPSAFYKIIYRQDQKGGKLIGFLLPHRPSDESIYKYMVSIDDIEREAGFDFFSQLPDDIENKLESQSNRKDW